MSPEAPDRLGMAFGGRYTTERELGAGGMATVYLAHDLKHDRKVALKVLKPELAAIVGADRFLAEIRTTANLQHPHILPLFDSGEAGGFLYFVMPYVEGESLRDRLDREKQLPVDEAVRIACEVADALAHAHSKGVIHRDVKPANILLRDGRVQVADFGIALAVQQAGGTRLTETGLSVGTPHYMSPEQAAGDRQLDGRSDIYSLGCVLYEMLAGEPPHTGSTAQAILSKILTETPRDLRELRDSVPAHLAAAVRTALSRLPADRFGTAGAFAATLASGKATVEPAAASRSSSRSALAVRVLPWLLAAAAILVLVVRESGTGASSSLSLDIALPDSAGLVFVGEATIGVGQTALAISPDGSTIVYVGRVGSTTRLYRRRVDSFEVVPLPGTEGAFRPFFSPDGRQVGFFASDQLKVTSIDGTGASVRTDVGDGAGGTWSDDGRIAVAARDGTRLLILPVSGPERRIELSDIGGRTIEWLPASDWIVRDCRGMYLCVTHATTGETRFLTLDGEPVASPDQGTPILGKHPYVTRNGFLLYGTRGSNNLMAVRFDAGSLSTRGIPREVVREVRTEAHSGSRQFAVSGNGTLVYVTGADASRGELVWIDANGTEEALPYPPQIYGAFALSPDGRQVAVAVTTEAGASRLEFLDVARTSPRVWSGPYEDGILGVTFWDGRSSNVYAWARKEESYALLGIPADAAAGGKVIREGEIPDVVEDRLMDGRLLVSRYGPGGIHFVEPDSLADWIPEEGDRVVDGALGALSPDNRWLSFAQMAADSYETWAVALPLEAPPRPVRVSVAGGESGVWSPKGDALFYRDGRRWYRAALTADPEHPFAEPRLFAEGNYLQIAGRSFAVSPAGDRLLLVRSVGAPGTNTLHVVTNWFDILERQAGE